MKVTIMSHTLIKLPFSKCSSGEKIIHKAKDRARKIFEFHLAHWASNSQILLARGTSPLAQVFNLINNS